MGARGLLGRLASASPERRIEQVDSVVENLRSLLNHREGSAVTVPTMGIPDFTDLVHNFPGSSMTLTKAIRATIVAYEPRLRNVRVVHIPTDEPLVVRFEVYAQIGKDADSGMRFRTEFAPGGRVNVWPGEAG